MADELKSFGFKIEWYATIEEGKEAIKDKFVSNNVILISTGSLTKPDYPGGSIIKIFSETENVGEKIIDHIIYCGDKKAYKEI